MPDEDKQKYTKMIILVKICLLRPYHMEHLVLGRRQIVRTSKAVHVCFAAEGIPSQDLYSKNKRQNILTLGCNERRALIQPSAP